MSLTINLNSKIINEPSAEAEEWRGVEGFPNYRISNMGRVETRYAMNLPRPGRQIGTGEWRALDYRPANTGYIPANLHNGKVVRRALVHQLVLETFVGPRPKGMVACHANGKRDDNRLVNLRWDTYKGNEVDKRTHGMQPYGEAIANAKLTNAEAIEVMRLIREGEMRQADIAKQFGVSQAMVCDIKYGRRYKAIIEAEYGPVIGVNILTDAEMEVANADYADDIQDRAFWMRGAW